jgi:hypothetical protein
MRSATEGTAVGRKRWRCAALPAALAALALGAGCGSWSNEDILFVAALPTREALALKVPASAGQALCAPPGPSQVWGWAKPVGDGLNAAVDAMLALVDLVKRTPPTTRETDARIWGPWDDQKHPGMEVRVTMRRSRDGAGVPSYAYLFEERPRGGAFQSVLDGSFRGESALAGKGTFALHFATVRALGISDHPDSDPYGDLSVQYDRTGDPRTLGLDVPAGPQSASLASFNYGYAGYQSGNGEFDYVFVNDQAQRYEVTARFDAHGAGRADVGVVLSPTVRLTFSECWDAAGCVTDVQDRAYAGLPDGLSKQCPGGVCLHGACPTF